MRVADISPDDAGEVERVFDAARQGDRHSFGRLVSLLQDRLFNAVFRMVGNRDDALEVTQETFTRALSNLESFRGQSQAYTWMFRIALNLVISQRRKASVRRGVSMDQPVAAGADGQLATLREKLRSLDAGPDENAIRMEQGRRVIDALNRLDEQTRAILVMRDIDGMDYQAMADVLELPLGTLKSRLFRARAALRAEMGEMGEA